MDQRARWQAFVEHAELSDVGLRRANNQDSFGLQMAGDEDHWKRRGHLFLVADGMGAHAAGELASKIAVDTITLTYAKLPDPSPADAIRKAVLTANSKIHATGEDNSDFKGMGTTCSALILLPQGAIAAHVGDSRIYRLRGNHFEQLSRDHSLVWEMTANSKVHERDLPNYIPKNIITRSLGPSDQVQVDLEGPFPFEPGDTFLICSDGLSGQVRDEEIGAVLSTLPPHEAVRVLIDLANLRGGPDNITVIVTQIKSTEGVTAPLWDAPGGGPSGTVHPFAWIGLGVSLLFAALMFVASQPMIGVVGLIGAMTAGIIAFWQKFATTTTTAGSTPLFNLGTGPHRDYPIQINAGYLEQLHGLIDPVCQTARDHQWLIDWRPYEQLRKASKAAADRGDFQTAFRELCRAVIYLMHEVRDQQNRTTDPAH